MPSAESWVLRGNRFGVLMFRCLGERCRIQLIWPRGTQLFDHWQTATGRPSRFVQGSPLPFSLILASSTTSPLPSSSPSLASSSSSSLLDLLVICILLSPLSEVNTSGVPVVKYLITLASWDRFSSKLFGIMSLSTRSKGLRSGGRQPTIMATETSAADSTQPGTAP